MEIEITLSLKDHDEALKVLNERRRMNITFLEVFREASLLPLYFLFHHAERQAVQAFLRTKERTDPLQRN